MTKSNGVHFCEKTCLGCGLSSKYWTYSGGDGLVTKHGDHFCCPNCSDGFLCECSTNSFVHSYINGWEVARGLKTTHPHHRGVRPRGYQWQFLGQLWSLTPLFLFVIIPLIS